MNTVQGQTLEPSKGHHMHPAIKFLLGGLGALAPVMTSLLIVDFEKVAEQLLTHSESLYWILGYTTRVFGLFLIGGMWAYLHKSEREPMKIFQLGIVAPAMLTGMLNASHVQTLRQDTSADEQFGISISFIAEAYAQQANGRQDPPNPTPADDFIKGILGK